MVEHTPHACMIMAMRSLWLCFACSFPQHHPPSIHNNGAPPQPYMSSASQLQLAPIAEASMFAQSSRHDLSAEHSNFSMQGGTRQKLRLLGASASTKQPAAMQPGIFTHDSYPESRHDPRRASPAQHAGPPAPMWGEASQHSHSVTAGRQEHSDQGRQVRGARPGARPDGTSHMHIAAAHDNRDVALSQGNRDESESEDDSEGGSPSAGDLDEDGLAPVCHRLSSDMQARSQLRVIHFVVCS